MEYANYILIFLASSMFFFLVIHMGTRFLQEKLEFSRSIRYERLRRFIAPQALLQKQIFFTLLTACVMFILQLAFGVEKMRIAVPVSLGFAALACVLTYFHYARKLWQRQELFESQILELAMGLENSMRSGSSISHALQVVASRMKDPMREELMVLIQECRLGLTLPDAFVRMQERMPCEDLHLLATSIALTSKSGGSLVEVLQEIVSTIRERTEFQGRLKNMTAQGRFEAVVISCAPLAAFLLLYVIDPILMKPMVTTELGWLMVGVVCMLISIGYFFIKKIVTIEV